MGLNAISIPGRRRIALAVGATTLAAMGTLGLSSQAFAGGCGQTFNPSTGGGQASWTLKCNGGNITMEGWVKDTDADGRCAFVKGVFNNDITEVAKACEKGKKTSFSWTHPGTIANGYLYVN